MAYAADIANAFEAHLIGLHVSTQIFDRSGLLGGKALDALRFSRDEEADHLRAAFDDITRDQHFVGQYQCLPAEEKDPASIVVARARAADLVIASQDDPEWPLSPVLDCSARLAVGAGRPLVVVPHDMRHKGLPRSVIVAGDQGREAARAMYDALPMMKGAKHVELFTCDEARAGVRPLLETQAELLPVSVVKDALADHGIKATTIAVKAAEHRVGEAICARAMQTQADLLVMGAYGHSRLSEFVFGGATRHVLKAAPVPTLFSH